MEGVLSSSVQFRAREFAGLHTAVHGPAAADLRKATRTFGSGCKLKPDFPVLLHSLKPYFIEAPKKPEPVQMNHKIGGIYDIGLQCQHGMGTISLLKRDLVGSSGTEQKLPWQLLLRPTVVPKA